MEIEIQDVHFIGNHSGLQNVGVELHKRNGEAFTRKLDDLKKDWDIVMKQVSALVSDSDSKVDNINFQLDEIKVALGFSATGKLAFIAEAGVEASIEVTFKRKILGS